MAEKVQDMDPRDINMAEKRGFLGWVGDKVLDAAYSDAMQQKVAQGSAEICQTLMGNADGHGPGGYTPYGAGQQPLEVEGPAIDYQNVLHDAGQEQQQDLGIDR